MPAFVPRTVASFERAATVVARRVAAPVRMLAARALSFADRIVGSWTGASPMVGGFESGGRPAMRAAARSGGMPMPRPWYEVDADEDAIWPEQAARAAAAEGATGPAPGALLPAAERGGAIERTALTAAPAAAARATTRAAETDDVPSPAAGARGGDARADLRVAEALGLRAPLVVPPPIVAPAARATTPLGRALAHAAWVDAQLRGVATPAEPAVRATTGYVFIAPADREGPVEANAQTPAARGAAVTATPAKVAPASTMAPRSVAVAPNVAAWSPSLPDPRLPAATPTPTVQRIADFMARLVGVQTARDAAPLSAAIASVEPAVAQARPTTPERTYVMLSAPTSAAVSWRPGAAAARMEQLGAHVDARVSAAWGEPASAVAVSPAGANGGIGPTAPGARGTSRAPSLPPDGSTASATIARAVPAIEHTYVTPIEAAPRPATGPARLSRFMEQLVGVQMARATAPLPVQAVIHAIVHAAEPAATAMTTAVSSRAPERVALAATTAVARSNGATPAATPAAMLAASVIPPAARRAAAGAAANATATAPGAIGRRAEQLGGVVGVRAASLSLDFVDPARLAMLTSGAPSMQTVAADAPARDTIMPAPQPLFATRVEAAASSSLTAEEWSLVATFPSAATAVQLAAARQSAQWSEVAAGARVAAAPVRTLLSAIAVSPAAAAAEPAAIAHQQSVAAIAGRGGAPAEYVVPSMAAGTPARLPGGRTPRGSFTWPKLAEPSPARAEWAAPAAVAAEYAKQAAPGTPLWGAMPAPILVAPSLAASTRRAVGTTAAGVLVGTAAGTAGPAGVTAGTAGPAGATAGMAGPAGVTAGAAGPAGATEGTAGAHGATTTGVRLPPSLAAAHELVRADASDATVRDQAAARSDAPAMTLMTAAATREARAAARMGAREPNAGDAGDAGAEAPEPAARPLTGGEAAARGSAPGISNVRPAAAMPLMTAGPVAREGGPAMGGLAGPAARALELARPFLRLVEGGIGGDAGQRSAAPRFFEQPQPLVSGAPAGDSASRIVEALRSQPAASGDDRVSLADLTLIAIASATQQVAASPTGGGPSGASAAEPAPGAAPEAASGHGGGKSGNSAQEIEELARAAFDELQRLIAMARERSGEHG